MSLRAPRRLGARFKEVRARAMTEAGELLVLLKSKGIAYDKSKNIA